jgi:hypothetical protein
MGIDFIRFFCFYLKRELNLQFLNRAMSFAVPYDATGFLAGRRTIIHAAGVANWASGASVEGPETSVYCCEDNQNQGIQPHRLRSQQAHNSHTLYPILIARPHRTAFRS